MDTNDNARFNPQINTGLTGDEVRLRREQGLTNTQPDHITKTTGQILKDNLLTLFNAFNIAIAICIALVGAYKNLLFLGVVVSNSLIGIVQEIRSKRMLDRLSLISRPRSTVVRDGQEQEIPAEELVLDDIIILHAGNQVCADSIVADGNVEVNESLLTGEAEPILKTRGDMLLSGSFIVSGKCFAKAEHIGDGNFAAKIAAEAKKYKRINSRLMNSLNQIVKFTSLFIIPFGILLFFHSRNFLRQSLTDSVLTTSAALLGMFPKGLVLLASVSLTVGVIKLSKQKVLVQELYCIEILSRVDTICIDKTGTITKGQMKVTNVIPLDKGALSVSIDDAAGSFVQALDDNNSTFMALKEYFKADKTLKPIHKTPFSSARKWSSVTFESIGTIIIGAPEILLQDQDYKLPEDVKGAQSAGSRVLLMAYSKDSADGKLPEELRPAAAIILQDEVRDNAGKILKFFHEQGVDIKVISGDNPATVSSIAKKAGLRGYESFVDAAALKTKEQIYDAAKKYTVFGRVMPGQKKELVSALKAQGHTVAMTGDGVNDVLALKEADCSIAMASGSDAARQISQLVLLDSDFAALREVVTEGRRVINNITRTASLYLVKTIFSFLLSLLAVFLSMPYPYIPVQLTLAGIFAEGVPSFFLALEPSHEKVQENFMFTVLTRAFPGALTIVFYTILVNMVLSPIFHIPHPESTTLCLYLMGFAWLIQLFKICLPFNKMRRALWIAMTAGFYSAAYFLRDIFSLSILAGPALAIFIILAAACYPLETLLYKITTKLSEAVVHKKL